MIDSFMVMGLLTDYFWDMIFSHYCKSVAFFWSVNYVFERYTHAQNKIEKITIFCV